MQKDTEKMWIEFNDQLKSFIRRHIPDKSAAEDILQDVFIKIHSQIDTLRDDMKIRGWIYRITRNTIIDYLRKRKVIFKELDTIDEVENGFNDSPV